MGEIVVGAVVGEAISRSSSFLAENVIHHTQVEIEKKLRRLDYLIIKMLSAISLSEKAKYVNNDSLKVWQARLHEIAHQGQEILSTMREQSWDYSSLNAAKHIKRWILGDLSTNQLNDTLEKSEEVSRDLGDFLRIIELELEI